jgi:hypothetical protein
VNQPEKPYRKAELSLGPTLKDMAFSTIPKQTSIRCKLQAFRVVYEMEGRLYPPGWAFLSAMFKNSKPHTLLQRNELPIGVNNTETLLILISVAHSLQEHQRIEH